MAADAGGARFIKDEKKLVTTKGLRESDVSMLFILAIIAVAALGIYFVLYPMFTNMKSLTGEVDELQVKEYEYKNQIAQTEIALKQYEEAQADYYRFFSYFYSPMDPEIIDERVTSMLIAHDMTPASFSMTTLTVEGISPYMADELRTNPVPETTEPPAAQEPPAEGSEGNLPDIPDPTPAPQPAPGFSTPADSYAFVYTINVSAYGNRDNLYTFLSQVSTMTAMHVISFNFSDPTTERDAEGKTTTKPGEINMQIKMYVLVDGVPARDFGELKMVR